MDAKNFLAEFEGLKDERPKIVEKIKSHNLPVIIFGGANLAMQVFEKLKDFGVEVSGYAVDAKYFQPNKTIGNLPAYNFDELCKTPEKFVFVLGVGTKNMSAAERIFKIIKNPSLHFYVLVPDESPSWCIDFDYLKNHSLEFFKTYELLSDDMSRIIMKDYLKSKLTYDMTFIQKHFQVNQYFNDLTRPAIQRGGIGFVDCGAYIGDTVEEFINFVGGDYGKIFALEPDERNFAALEKFIHEKNYKNVECINCGVWDKKDTLYFSGGTDSASHIAQSADSQIQVDALDNLIGNNKVDWIKMDLEGSELKALEGAKKTIQKFKPVLTICVYHKKEDLIILPQFIDSLNCNYKFYLRHHSHLAEELVLYAIPK